MTAIVALSGKKQAGKSTLCEYLRYNAELLIQHNKEYSIKQDRNGLLSVAVDNGETHPVHLVDSTITKVYSFADAIKEYCVDILGLRPEQVYGSDDDKNSLTPFSWENLPTFIRWNNGSREMQVAGFPASTKLAEDVTRRLKTESDFYSAVRSGFYPTDASLKTGLMTAREVMQILGTDIMRTMFTNKIWVNATFRRINRDKPAIAFIADLRFPSELEALVENGGHVIRLDRILFAEDRHPSETALDGWDWESTPRCLRVPDCDIPTRNSLAWDYVKQFVISTKQTA